MPLDSLLCFLDGGHVDLVLGERNACPYVADVARIGLGADGSGLDVVARGNGRARIGEPFDEIPDRRVDGGNVRLDDVLVVAGGGGRWGCRGGWRQEDRVGARVVGWIAELANRLADQVRLRGGELLMRHILPKRGRDQRGIPA